MSIRFKVVRGFVYYRKKAYYAGELMPEGFTERDQARNVYSRRLEKVEIPDEPSTKVIIPELDLELEPIQEIAIEVTQDLTEVDEENKSASDETAENTMVPELDLAGTAKTPVVAPQKIAPKKAVTHLKK